MASKNFIKVTNQDVYQEIIDLKKKTEERHEELLSHVMKTNGKVGLNRWIATTALTLIVAVIMTLISIKGG